MVSMLCVIPFHLRVLGSEFSVVVYDLALLKLLSLPLIRIFPMVGERIEILCAYIYVYVFRCVWNRISV